LRLRVQDVDFERNQIIVRGGKGDQDRVTVLPDKLKLELQRHLERVKWLQERDWAAGLGMVWLPGALRVKDPNVEREWVWQWVFPASGLSNDPHGVNFNLGSTESRPTGLRPSGDVPAERQGTPPYRDSTAASLERDECATGDESGGGGGAA
jgi:integrase